MLCILHSRFLLNIIMSFCCHHRIFSKLLILVSHLSALLLTDGQDESMLHYLAWHFLALASFAFHVSVYIDTLELVPGEWLVYTALGLFGLHWAAASAYAVALMQHVATWHVRY